MLRLIDQAIAPIDQNYNYIFDSPDEGDVDVNAADRWWTLDTVPTEDEGVAGDIFIGIGCGIGVLAIAGFTFITSLVTILVINKIIPIRASDEEQELGLDVTEIGIEAYPEFK